MHITLDNAGSLLAFVIAGISAGSWAAFVTFQVHALRKELREIRVALKRLGMAIGA
jgi:hypothetical protein